MFSDKDHMYMARALQLAKRGLYTTKPNPCVGCLIVNSGQVVGEGFHAFAGGPHAEVEALRQAGERARGADVFVTLEPCAHHGKTGPCSDALVEAGVSRVVYGASDPNPLVSGRGLERMRQCGIEVEGGLMSNESESMNRGFVSRMKLGRPYICVKVGASLDGRIAMESGESQWITGPAARKDVQRLRAGAGAILTGSGTVRADNPSLNVRCESIGLREDECVQPVRVVAGSLPNTLSSKNIVSGAQRTVWFTHDAGRDAQVESIDNLDIQTLKADGGFIPMLLVMQRLADMQINEVLVEAGPKLVGSLIESELYDELIVYMAPKLLGHKGRPLAELSFATLGESPHLQLKGASHIDDDLKLVFRKKH